MKTCPYCKIKVGGDLKKCPLCQSKIVGEGESYYPSPSILKLRSPLYRIQLFIVWVVIIAALGIDFLFNLRMPGFENVHYSLIIAMWLMVFEFVIMNQFQRGTGSSRNMTLLVFLLLGMLLITSYFFGFFDFTVDWIVPIALSAAMVANFVLAMIDKQGNAMAYLLTNIFVGAVPYAVMYFSHRETPVTWILCLMISVVLFAGAVVFKGRAVAAEFRRRLNL